MAKGIPSPEVDLLERLSAQDESLHSTLVGFGPLDNPQTLKRAQHVVGIYVKAGIVQLLHQTENGEHEVPTWERRVVLGSIENWMLSPAKESYYFLRLTAKGQESFIQDSEGFFRELFSETKPKRVGDRRRRTS